MKKRKFSWDDNNKLVEHIKKHILYDITCWRENELKYYYKNKEFEQIKWEKCLKIDYVDFNSKIMIFYQYMPMNCSTHTMHSVLKMQVKPGLSLLVSQRKAL